MSFLKDLPRILPLKHIGTAVGITCAACCMLDARPMNDRGFAVGSAAPYNPTGQIDPCYSFSAMILALLVFVREYAKYQVIEYVSYGHSLRPYLNCHRESGLCISTGAQLVYVVQLHSSSMISRLMISNLMIHF